MSLNMAGRAGRDRARRLVKCSPVYLPKGARLEARRARLLPDPALPASRRRRRRVRRHLRRRRRRRSRSAPASSRRRWRRACSAWPRAARSRSRSPPARRSASAIRRCVHRVSRAVLDAEGDADGDYRVGDVVRFPGARRPVDRRRRSRRRGRRARLRLQPSARRPRRDVRRQADRRPVRRRVLDEVVLAEPRGFCAGVDRAIEIVERALQKFGAPIYVRHEIVHNTYVVDDLKTQGRDLHRGPRRRAAPARRSSSAPTACRSRCARRRRSAASRSSTRPARS